MKLYPDKLAAQLNKGLSRTYIVSGDEPLLVQESCDLIRAGLKARGFAERDLFHVESGFDWSSLLFSANSMSLFSRQKLIEVRLASGKPGDEGGKALVQLVSQLNEDTVLLLVLPRLDQSSQRTKWFKTIESDAAFVQVWPIEARELPRWLDARFRQAGLQATREAVRIMATRLEGNLLAAVQEIERLKLIVSGREVDVEDVLDGVADSARYDVFKLIDAAMLGDMNRCVRMTSGLKAEGVEPLFVVNMLSRELRSLESMKGQMIDGKSQGEVFKKARVWDKKVPMVTRCLERHDLRKLQELQVSLGTIDRMVKGVVAGEAWQELQTVILDLAGAPLMLRV